LNNEDEEQYCFKISSHVEELVVVVPQLVAVPLQQTSCGDCEIGDNMGVGFNEEDVPPIFLYKKFF
jgi:hypothetical protein